SSCASFPSPRFHWLNLRRARPATATRSMPENHCRHSVCRRSRSSKGSSCPVLPIADANCGTLSASWSTNSLRLCWCSTCAAPPLLDLLCRAGCRLRYHGDLDPPGIAIANMLMQRFAVDPWRMSAADYVSAVSTAGPSLRGRALDAIWDDQLSSQMHSRGKAVLEESVLGLLISDLERGSEDGEHSTAT